MEKQIVITNKSTFGGEINKISTNGADKFHVLADFDRTLTKNTAPDGTKISSLISILRDENYLTPDYPEKAKSLAKYYISIEKNPKISLDERIKAMHEWWTKHFDLLIKSKLNKKDIEKAVLSHRLQLRQGVEEFLKFLKGKNIPLVILSSNGLGDESISIYLKNKNLLFDNIYIISNKYEWDKNGFAVGIKKPIIHTLNKDETILKNFPFYKKIADRKNIFLLGDSPSDVDMITGFDYDNLFKIGFWNEPTPENQSVYEKNYDMLIKNDGSFEQINEILKQMFD
ncbi:hypothetical protein ACFL1Y_00445 [Patescibacteria group bacterium]